MWLIAVGIIIGISFGILVLDYLIRTPASDYETRMAVGIPIFISLVVLLFLTSLLAGLIISRNNREIDMVVALKDPE
jgi:ABC-type antimicrobial peptide transport system permease subunit